jgi:purine-binding chemotaxis protein CheW
MVNTNGTTHPGLDGKYLTFALSREQYGVDILKVQEIIGVTPITRVPRCPDFIKGVINLRGRIIPVVDLRLRFGMEPAPYDDKTCIVVMSIPLGDKRLALGVIVDTVVEVLHFSREDIEPAPDYGVAVDSSVILGIGKREDTLSILLDIERILTKDESLELTTMHSES